MRISIFVSQEKGSRTRCVSAQRGSFHRHLKGASFTRFFLPFCRGYFQVLSRVSWKANSSSAVPLASHPHVCHVQGRGFDLAASACWGYSPGRTRSVPELRCCSLC